MVVAQCKYDNSMNDRIKIPTKNTQTLILMKYWKSDRKYVIHDHSRNSNINISTHTIVKQLTANSYNIIQAQIVKQSYNLKMPLKL